MSGDNCPVCGSKRYYDQYAFYPEKGKMCCDCGYECFNTHTDRKASIIPQMLSDYCGIPCDLCSKVFGTKGECPQGVEPCGGEKHWKLLLERIESNGTAQYRQAERMW